MEAREHYPNMRARRHAQLRFKVQWQPDTAREMHGGSEEDERAVLPVANALLHAMEHRRARVLAMGAHAIKLGLTPEIVRLLDMGVFTGLLVTGSVLIHDYELHLHGATSQDVQAGLESGEYGSCAETAAFMEHVAHQGQRSGQGLGYVAAEYIAAITEYTGYGRSLLAACYQNEIPVAVAVALGTDTCHWHEGFDGAALGQACAISLRNVPFWIRALHCGGVWINAGSAVVLPEVFLKGVMLVRNQTKGEYPRRFTAVVVDQQELYRPARNVLERPGGTPYFLQMPLEVFWPILGAQFTIGKPNEGGGQCSTDGG